MGIEKAFRILIDNMAMYPGVKDKILEALAEEEKPKAPEEKKDLLVENILNLFRIFQLTEHFEQTTKTGIPDWNYKDLAQAISDMIRKEPDKWFKADLVDDNCGELPGLRVWRVKAR